MERIVADNISKKFKIGFKKNQSALARFISLFSGKEPKKIIWAVKEASFRVNAGEIVGVIGENGSGKSTLLRVIAGIYNQNEGKISVNGKTISLMNLGIGLKPRLTMKDNIYLVASLFGLSQKEISERFASILEFSKLGRFINTKIYQFSDGMLQRLAFSTAIHCNPQILLVDEVFEVGDEEFKIKSASKIEELIKHGLSVLLVSHNMDMIKKHCARAIWMKQGKIVKQGRTNEVVEEYLTNNFG